MKVPFIKYIETLVVGRLTDDQILDKLKDLNLSFPEKYIPIVRQHFRDLQPEYFTDLTVPVEVSWLVEWDIDKMYSYIFKIPVPNGTAGIAGAFEIMSDQNMHRVITSLAMAKITDEDIELIVNGKYNIHYVSEDIEEFLHYFFNIEDWSIGDRKKYISSLTKEGEKKLKFFYKFALEEEKDFLIWKLGAASTKSFQAMMQDMAVDSYYNFKEHSRIDSEVAQKWAGVAIKLADKFNTYEKENRDTKKMFLDDIQFKITDKRQEDRDKDDKPRKHIGDLE